MSIDFQTLKCAECGSADQRREAPRTYRCGHCGAVSLVEDSVSERLDRLLEQMTDAAGERLAQETAAHGRRVLSLALGWGLGLALVLGTVFGGIALLQSRRPPPTVTLTAPPPARPPAIPLAALALSEPREVLLRRARSVSSRWLVMVHNRHEAALQRPGLEARFAGADGAAPDLRHPSLPLDLIGPGEQLPLLIDAPREGAGPAPVLQVRELSAPGRLLAGPALAFSRQRLVQMGEQEEVRFVGRIQHAQGQPPLVQIEALVVLYDDRGAVVGVGHGHAPGPVAPGQSATLDFTLPLFAGARVAAWDVRLGHRLLQPDGSRLPVLGPGRVRRTEGGPELLPPLPTSSEDLLAGDDERFDPEALELLPVVMLRDSTQRPLYVTELVNRSRDAIAVTPALRMTPLDGGQPGRPQVVNGPALLYPGERLPIRLQAEGLAQVSGWRTEWKPMRRAALPGSRLPVEVTVGPTEALWGRAVVNFTQEFRFRYVRVQGTVHNPGPGVVRKLGLWVTLRDAQGRLTGFERVGSLPALAPGDSAPWSASIHQWGREAAKVETLAQAE